MAEPALASRPPDNNGCRMHPEYNFTCGTCNGLFDKDGNPTPPVDSKGAETAGDVQSKIMQIADKVLLDLRDAGYFIEENSDLEVAQAISVASYAIANEAIKVFDPSEYVLIDGLVYSKDDIKKTAPRKANK